MSKNTENYKLYTFTSDSDVADLKLLEPTFDTIDKGLVLDVGESTGSGNNYILNLGSITLTSANKGISFKFWADKDSKGAVTINGTYKLIKANGSSVTNLKKGAPYTITYDGGTNFFLASGGGLDTVNFTSDKLLTGYSANNSNGEKVDGTMPNRGTMNVNLSLNGQTNLPPGYYSGVNITQNVTTRGAHTNAISNGVDDNYLYTRIPTGAYFSKTSTGYPEIKSKISDVANALKGLSSDKKGEVISDLGGCQIRSGVKTSTTGGKADNGSTFLDSRIDLTNELKDFSPDIIFGYGTNSAYCFMYNLSNTRGSIPYYKSAGTTITPTLNDRYMMNTLVNTASVVIPSSIAVEINGNTTNVHWWAIKF